MFAMQNLTAGQLNALVKKVGGEKVVRDILDGTMKFVVEAAKKLTINLNDFFKTREGLWVSDEFKERIIAPALAVPEAVPASIGEPYKLSKDIADAQILEKLGNKVFENPRAFLNTLARLIDEQWGGKEGDLLNNGYSNLFYVCCRNEEGEIELFVVVVRWGAHFGRWFVFAYRLDDAAWGRGVRAFPSN